jgi:hypothetical protein
MTKLNVVLSLAAGLLGGAISHYLSPDLVHAQSQALKLFDERGREIWSAGGRINVPTAVLGR